MNDQPDRPAQQRRQRRWPRRLLIVFLVLGCLYGVYRYTLYRMVEAKLDEIRKQGYPVTLAELDKWYPQVPPGENAAEVYTQAFAHCDRFWGTNSIAQSASAITNQWPYWQEGTEWMQQQLLPVVGKAKLPPGSPPLPQEMKRLVATYVSDHREALELLHQATGKIKCRYPIDLTKIYQEDELGAEEDKYFPHWQGVNFSARLLQLETVMHAENGDPESAVNSLFALLALARSLRSEPGLVAHLVRCRVESAGLSSLEYTLNRLKLPVSQIERLQTRFGESETTRQTISPIVGELCEGNAALGSDPWLLLTIGCLHQMNRSHRSTLPFGLAVIDRVYSAAGFFDLDQLRFLNYMSEKLQTIRRLSDLPDSRLVDHDVPRFSLFYPWLVDTTESSMKRECKARARVRTGQAALAVEASELRSYKLPDELNEIVPSFLTAIPTDPFTGQPLRYKKLAKGYVVYSVGEDGKDDGGDEKKDITFTVER